MGLLKTLPILAALSAPIFGVGCNETKPKISVVKTEKEEKSEQGQVVEKEQPKENNTTIIVVPRSHPQPLKDFRGEFPGIDIYDENQDQILDASEVDKYIRVQVDKDQNGILSYEEIKLFYDNYKTLHDRVKSRDYSFKENIYTSFDNLERRYLQELENFRDRRSAEIQERLNKYNEAHKTKSTTAEAEEVKK